MSDIIGLACTIDIQSFWSDRILRTGYKPRAMPLMATPKEPHNAVTTWVIPLHPHDPPQHYRLWLECLHGRLILITPQLHVARKLEAYVPQLAMIAHPTRAANYLADLLSMVIHGRGPLLVLGPMAR